MSESFDPYHKWLGISPKDQPPHHYRLLGVDPFERDLDVIEAAANRQMIYIQGCAAGPHVALSQRILNEIAQARLALLDPARKSAYDKQLRAKLGAAATPTPAARGVRNLRVASAGPFAGPRVRASGANENSLPASPVDPLAAEQAPASKKPEMAAGGSLAPHENIPPETPTEEPSVGERTVTVDLAAERSPAATGSPRGRTKIRIDWRFPLFVIVAAGLIVGGVMLATRLSALLNLSHDQPQPTSAAPHP